MHIKSAIGGALIASAALIFIFTLIVIGGRVEYQVRTRQGWPEYITVYQQPAGEGMRLVDNRTGETVFSYTETLPVQPAQIENIGPGKWRIILEDLRQHKIGNARNFWV
jgi:hypothetical protein